MRNLDFEARALKLLEILTRHAETGTDNIKYLSFVLESHYEEGLKDGLYRLDGETRDNLL